MTEDFYSNSINQIELKFKRQNEIQVSKYDRFSEMEFATKQKYVLLSNIHHIMKPMIIRIYKLLEKFDLIREIRVYCIN